MARDPLRDAENAAVGMAMNNPGLAVTLIVGVIGLAIGYYFGHHGLPAGIGPSPSGTSQDDISVHFSPKGGCTEAAVAEIDASRQSIDVQAYSFTSRDIAAALIKAERRGVKVTIIVDEKDLREGHSKAGDCFHAGCTVYADGVHAIAHNKIILIDGRAIVTGSFNFTEQAESRNAENLIVLHSKTDLYAAYEKNFQMHVGHSQPYSDSMTKEGRRARTD